MYGIVEVSVTSVNIVVVCMRYDCVHVYCTALVFLAVGVKSKYIFYSSIYCVNSATATIHDLSVVIQSCSFFKCSLPCRFCAPIFR